jgi:hypothetical protein
MTSVAFSVTVSVIVSVAIHMAVSGCQWLSVTVMLIPSTNDLGSRILHALHSPSPPKASHVLQLVCIIYGAPTDLHVHLHIYLHKQIQLQLHDAPVELHVQATRAAGSFQRQRMAASLGHTPLSPSYDGQPISRRLVASAGGTPTLSGVVPSSSFSSSPWQHSSQSLGIMAGVQEGLLFILNRHKQRCLEVSHCGARRCWRFHMLK